MVFFLIEPNHLQAVLSLAKESNSEVWLGSDALTEQKLTELRVSGHKITRFSHALSGAAPSLVASDLITIKEHHPNEVIWVQHVA